MAAAAGFAGWGAGRVDDAGEPGPPGTVCGGVVAAPTPLEAAESSVGAADATEVEAEDEADCAVDGESTAAVDWPVDPGSVLPAGTPHAIHLPAPKNASAITARRELATTTR